VVDNGHMIRHTCLDRYVGIPPETLMDCSERHNVAASAARDGGASACCRLASKKFRFVFSQIIEAR
jgi:hypothetical protein